MSNFDQLQGKVDDTKRTLYENVDKVTANVNQLSQTNESAAILVTQAEAVKTQAGKAQRRERWRQMKCYLFIAVLLIALVGVIAGVLVWKTQNKNSNSGNSGRKLLATFVGLEADMLDGLDW